MQTILPRFLVVYPFFNYFKLLFQIHAYFSKTFHGLQTVSYCFPINVPGSINRNWWSKKEICSTESIVFFQSLRLHQLLRLCQCQNSWLCLQSIITILHAPVKQFSSFSTLVAFNLDLFLPGRSELNSSSEVS